MRVLTILLLSSAVASAAAQRAVPSHDIARPARAPLREVARVNGVALMSDRLDAAVGALIPMESFHRNVSAEKMADLRQQALRTIVDEELEYQDGVRRGIAVTQAQVDAGLAQLVAKYGGRQAFDAALRNAGASLSSARREVRKRLTIERTHNRVVVTRCQVSREEAVRFFTANPDRFVEPEQLHVYAITVRVDPSSSAQQWAAARAQADDLLKRVKAGASFEALAEDMGFVHRGSLSEPFEKVAQELPLGQPSAVIETLYGYHIVRVSEIRPPQKKTFTDVGVTVQKDLTAKRCTEMNDEWIAGLRAAAQVVYPQ